jgi:hypothetical protein
MIAVPLLHFLEPFQITAVHDQLAPFRKRRDRGPVTRRIVEALLDPESRGPDRMLPQQGVGHRDRTTQLAEAEQATREGHC